MGTQDVRVDAYIAKSADFAKPILTRLRRVIHKNCPAAAETIKWGFPFFMYNGGILCATAAFKLHCTFGFWHREMGTEVKRLAPGAGSDERSLGQFGRITSADDLPSDAVLAKLVRRAMELSESPETPARKPRKPAKKLPVPAFMAKALRQDAKAREHFNAMSPSHQNEYVEWITEAKRPETRDRRIATMLQWLREGKSRTWKYER
jgi:uncharacterized protein YdeI (YjbR/CyaY-like superfamily)